MDLYAVKEKTGEFDSNFDTFFIASTLKKAEYVKELYEKNYPQNEYEIEHHILDDNRLIEMEEK